MFKITEKIVEPPRIEVGSTFKLKVKVVRFATYNEIKNRLTYNTLKNYKYSDLKGE